MAFKVNGKEYKIAISGTPVRQDISKFDQSQVRIRSTVDCVLKFGNSSVTASNTVTSNENVDGNFTISSSAIEVFQLSPNSKYVSIVSEDGTSTGNIYLTFGSGE
jgi:hypothetical protein